MKADTSAAGGSGGPAAVGVGDADYAEDLRLLVDGAEDFAMILSDHDRRVVRWSPGAERLFGWSEAEAVGQWCDIVFTPEDRAAGVPEKEQDTALREGRVEDERWHVKKDGSRFFVSGVVRPLYGPDGGLRGFGKVLRDVTARKRLEDELRASRAGLDQAMASARMFRWELDPATGRFSYSENAERVLGFPLSADVIGDPAGSRIRPDHAERAVARTLHSLETGEPYEDTVPFVDPATGATVWLHSQAVVSEEEAEGRGRRFVGLARNVTAQKEAEEALHASVAALRESEARFRLMADAVPQIVWITDPEGRTEFFNRQWSEYTGRPYEPTTAARVATEHVHPEDAAATLEAFDAARRGAPAPRSRSSTASGPPRASTAGSWCAPSRTATRKPAGSCAGSAPPPTSTTANSPRPSCAGQTRRSRRRTTRWRHGSPSARRSWRRPPRGGARSWHGWW